MFTFGTIAAYKIVSYLGKSKKNLGLKTTKDNLDINNAKKILNETHDGLSIVKNQILDFIASLSCNKNCTPTVLCLVGPPGVGKTSIVKSIAKSLNKNYAKIALGGTSDSRDLKGSKPIYLSAQPGKIAKAMQKAKSLNPVLLLDEIDKINNFNPISGNPSGVLLEILDPQQNNNFYDKCLGSSIDLSKVLFIATANDAHSIPGPLRSRMEIIHIPGYTQEEKINIAKNYIIKKVAKEINLNNETLYIDDETIKTIIDSYTMEAGVRQLEREIKKLYSKAARQILENKTVPIFTPLNITDYLGKKKIINEYEKQKDQIGIMNGLAWSPYGGSILKIESLLRPGHGQLILTGNLKKVISESAQIAMTYVRAHEKEFKIDPKLLSKHDLHIHFPAGSIIKDGPSAGGAILISILSSLAQQPISANYAMTGELNLRGDIMPIGGLKEKILAAKKNKIPHVIIPEKNRNDLIGLEKIQKGINIIFVKHINEVIDIILPTVRKSKQN